MYTSTIFDNWLDRSGTSQTPCGSVAKATGGRNEVKKGKRVRIYSLGGHTISIEGLQTANSKVEAIINALAPKKVAKLRSFLGLVNYYSKFLPNLATTLSPLYTLLWKRQEWSWDQNQIKAGEEPPEIVPGVGAFR